MGGARDAARLSGMIAGAALALAGCRPGNQGSAAGHDSAGAATAVPSPATPPVVTVHARDYAFAAPDQIPAGMTTFRLVNDGETFHHLIIVRLDSGKSVSDVQQALQRQGPPPGWMVFVGGPNAPDPHAEANATVDLSAGTYALLCFVDVPGKVPHVAKGMLQPLVVTAATTPSAPAPTPDVTITLSDYKFDVAGPVRSGRRTFAVRTGAGQPHELELVRLEPGKTPQDMINWIEQPKGPPPGHAVGGAAAAAHTSVYFTADLTPGNYALICFLPDAKDGKPHFAHGMIQTLDVT